MSKKICLSAESGASPGTSSNVTYKFDRWYTFIYFPMEQLDYMDDKVYSLKESPPPDNSGLFSSFIMTLEIPSCANPDLQILFKPATPPMVPHTTPNMLKLMLSNLPKKSQIRLELNETLNIFLDAQPTILSLPETENSSRCVLKLNRRRMMQYVSADITGSLSVFSFISENEQSLLQRIQVKGLTFPFPVEHLNINEYEKLHIEMIEQQEEIQKLEEINRKQLEIPVEEESFAEKSAGSKRKWSATSVNPIAFLRNEVEVNIRTNKELQYFLQEFIERKDFSISRLLLGPQDMYAVPTDDDEAEARFPPEDIFQVSRCLENLNKIFFAHIILHFSSLERVEKFSNFLVQHGRISNVTFIDTRISIDGIEKNANLVLLIKLTGEYDQLEFVEKGGVALEDETKYEKLQFVSLFFSRGVLTSFTVDGSLNAGCCENVSKFCRNWHFRSNLSSVKCSNLKLSCSKTACEKCSILMIMVVACNKDCDNMEERVLGYDKSVVEPIRIIFGRNRFKISHVFYTAEELQRYMPFPTGSKLRQHVSIEFGKLNISLEHHEARSKIKDFLLPAVSVMEDFGIEIKTLNIHVDINDEGWSFIRIPVSKHEIEVEFNNDIFVTFPPNSIKNLTTIEVDTSIKSSDLESICLKSILTINQVSSTSFMKQINVKTSISEAEMTNIVFKQFTSNEWRYIGKRGKMTIVGKYSTLCLEQTGTLCTFSEKGDDFHHFDDLVREIDEYILGSIYLVVKPESESDSVIVDCVQHGSEEMDDFKSDSKSELMRIKNMGADDRITAQVLGNISVEEELLEDGKSSKPSSLVFYHPKKQRNLRKLRVSIIDSLSDSTGALKLHLEKTDDTRRTYYLEFCFQKTDLTFPLEPVADSFVSLSGLINCEPYSCLLNLAVEADTFMDPEKGNQTLSLDDLVIVVEIMEENSQPNFEVSCRFLDEWTRNQINLKSPTSFQVKKVSVQHLDQIHTVFSGNLELARKKLARSINRNGFPLDFNVTTSDNYNFLEGNIKMKMIQKLSKDEIDELCSFNIGMTFFPPGQLISRSNMYWDNQISSAKCRIGLSINSLEELRQLFSRSLTDCILLSRIRIVLESIQKTQIESVSENSLSRGIESLEIILDFIETAAINLLLTKFTNFKHLELFVNDFLPSESAEENALFKGFVPISSLPNGLKSIKLSRVRSPVIIDDLFEILTANLDTCPTGVQLIQFSGMKIHWNSIEQVQKFADKLRTYVQKIREVELLFDNTVMGISTGVYKNVSLLLSVVLTCNSTASFNKIKTLVENEKLIMRTEEKHEALQHLRVKFENSILETIEITAVIMATSCKRLAEFCELWRIDEKIVSFKFENLLMGWSEASLSSVWFALANPKHARQNKLKELIGRTVFSQNTMSAIKYFIREHAVGEILNADELNACEVKVQVDCDESRYLQLLAQDEMMSTLRKCGIDIDQFTLFVDTDKTGWGFIKLNLSVVKTVVKFNSNVEVTFPAKSTIDSLFVCIEVHQIPDDVIQRVCQEEGIEEYCHLSPVVFIDHEQETPFLQPVSIEVPYSTRKGELFGETLSTRAYTKHKCEIDWKTVSEENLVKLTHTIRYESKQFSPFAAITECVRSCLSFLCFVRDYFGKCVYVTISPLATKEKPHNVEFNCVKPTEAQLEDLKLNTAGYRSGELRKVGIMRREDRILVKLEPNLRMDKFFHKEKAERRLQFFYPENVKNLQERILEKVDSSKDAQGIATYSLVRTEVEDELFQICYTIPRYHMDDKTAENDGLIQEGEDLNFDDWL